MGLSKGKAWRKAFIIGCESCLYGVWGRGRVRAGVSKLGSRGPLSSNFSQNTCLEVSSMSSKSLMSWFSCYWGWRLGDKFCRTEEDWTGLETPGLRVSFCRINVIEIKL